MAKRLYYIDLLRILAVFLVVLIHNIRLPQEISLITFPSFIILASAKTSVPLFIMLSGALLLGKIESYKIFFKKRATRILMPWIIWSLVFFIIDKSDSLFVVVMTRFWFLPLIVSLYLLTPFLRLAIAKAKKRDLYFIIGLWLVGIICLPYIYSFNTFSVGNSGSLITQTIQYLGYFLLGYLLSQIKKTKQFLALSSSLILIGILTPITLTMVYPPPQSDYLKYFDYVSPFVVASSVGIFLLVKNRFGKDGKYSSWVRSLSDASFGIIFVHELFNYFFWHNSSNPLAFMSNFTYVGYDFIRAILSFSCALVVVLLIRQIKIFRNIVV